MMRQVVVLALGLALLAPGRVWAQPKASPTPPTDQASEKKRTELYRRGAALARAGKWAEAAAKFRQVIEIRSAPKALIALGISEENLGHLLESQSAYRQAIQNARAQKLAEEEREALEALRLVQRRIPRINVDTGDVAGVSVLVDGKPTRRTAGEIQVDPGQRTIQVRAPGHRSFETAMQVDLGDRLAIKAELPSLEVPGPFSQARPEAIIPPPPTRSAPTGAVVLSVLGVGAVAGGVVLWVVGANESAGQTATGEIAGGTALFVAGAVATGIGLAWLISPPAPPVQAGSVRLVAAPMLGGGWAGMAGSF